MKKVHIVTLGCEKNENDMENLKGLLIKKGFHIEQKASAADAIVVHTCSFIEAAKKESISSIIQASVDKKSNAKIYVTGCLVQQHGKELLDDLPEADALLGTGQLEQIPTLLENPRDRFLDRKNPGGLMDQETDRALSPGTITTSLRLSEGCSHPCSFCVIPKLRGGIQSRTEHQILAEANGLAQRGIEELLIIGQDTGDWGRDLPGKPALVNLLTQLSDIKQFRWIRLMYLHPHSMSKPLLNFLANHPEQFPYLDMPFQHIDAAVLSRMNRLNTEKELRQLIDAIKTKAPRLSLRTTLIVGFPGETEAEFQKLYDFVREGHFDYLGAFAYSQEESTPAALLADQLPDEVKNARLDAIKEAQYQASIEKAQKRIGSTVEILIDSEESDALIGRTAMEAPDVDAIIRLPKKAARRGKWVKARLISYDAYEYTAELI